MIDFEAEAMICPPLRPSVPPRRALAVVASVLGLLLAPLAADAAGRGPSFDCAGAKGRVEKAICADRELSRLDLALADAYRAALARLDGDAEAQAALRAAQRSFLSVRDARIGDAEFTVADAMSRQLDLLAGIDGAPRTEFVGVWAGHASELKVERPAPGDAAIPAGAFRVSIDAVEPTRARWLCDATGIGRLVGDALVVSAPPADDVLEGWTLKIVRRGHVVDLYEIGPPGTERDATGFYYGMRPFCGMNGGVAGTYFPVGKARP